MAMYVEKYSEERCCQKIFYNFLKSILQHLFFRLIVKNLVQKGATVRALVRSVYRARNLKQLQGAEVCFKILYYYLSASYRYFNFMLFDTVCTANYDILSWNE